MTLHNYTVPTNSTNKHSRKINHPPSPIIVRVSALGPQTATSSARIRQAMEDHTLIDGEVRRRKRNNTRLQKEEEDRHLIADGEGKNRLDS